MKTENNKLRHTCTCTFRCTMYMYYEVFICTCAVNEKINISVMSSFINNIQGKKNTGKEKYPHTLQ